MRRVDKRGRVALRAFRWARCRPDREAIEEDGGRDDGRDPGDADEPTEHVAGLVRDEGA